MEYKLVLIYEFSTFVYIENETQVRWCKKNVYWKILVVSIFLHLQLHNEWKYMWLIINVQCDR